MNYAPVYGWFYTNVDKRAPAWTSVMYLYNFLTGNKGLGPYGKEVKISEVKKGDVVQLITDGEDYHHTLIITLVQGAPSLDTILVTAHTIDCSNRQLATYNIKAIRFIEISGFRCK